MHYPKPHFPLRPPERWFRYYQSIARGQIEPLPLEALSTHPPVHRLAWSNYLGYGATQEDLDRSLAAYAGCVSYVDECIGHLLSSVEHLGLADDTLIVYSADHGEMAGAHGLWHKQLFYEESVRIPLVVRGPDVPQGEAQNTLVSLIDIFPTLCDLAGQPIPEETAGVSLLPMMRGSQPTADRTIFSEIAWREDWQGCMVRQGNWKYCWYLDGAAELYDLAKDPCENHNLAEAPVATATRDELHKRLVEFWRPDEQEERRTTLPRLKDNKGQYVAMQYCLRDGTWADAWP